MPATKRVLEGDPSTPRAKKAKFADQEAVESKLTAEEVDFPRGGGSSFTPLEVKTIRAEAIQEANGELFKNTQMIKKKVRKFDAKNTAPKDHIRVEHLNYKRIVVGMKIFGQIVSVQPLALVVSLPNQLLGHVPITQISSTLTNILETMDEDGPPSDDDEEGNKMSRVPDTFSIFTPGQYVRAVVTAVHAAGSTDALGIGKTRDETAKASRRVELSLSPDRINNGVLRGDLRAGFTLTAAIRSLEDHGYILDLGVPDISGFLSYAETKKASFDNPKMLQIGQLLDVCVLKLSDNGRTCTVTVDPEKIASSSLSEVTNVTSVLPGSLVQSLVTAVLPSGLNLQILGFFEGTVNQIHVPPNETYKTGQKIKARILYDIASTTPPRFSLTLLNHVMALDVKHVKNESIKKYVSLQDAYPVGLVLDNVTVRNVESERGLSVVISPGVEGFVHISQTSDEHVPSLSSSSGPWKIGSAHRARVTGYFAFDGLLQVSLRQSVLDQQYLQVTDVHVGEIVKGTIKRLTDSGLFVSISGNVDGVVWPNHYADIKLKHPSKRFKPGASIKCRVLTVDPGRKRISLSAKKTLIESALPIVSKIGDAKVGLITHAVVFKISDKGLQIEFYNGLKAFVPAREASDVSATNLSDAFFIGKVVKVRIININIETSQLAASIKQAMSNSKSIITDISGVEIGNTVEGAISEIHKENVILTLQPTQVRALMSMTNLANHRGLSLPQLRVSLKIGDQVEQVFVVSRNSEKGFVVVAAKPKSTSIVTPKGSLSFDTIQVGQIVGGRVIRHGRNGTHIKLTSRIVGALHPTDACDDFEVGVSFPAIDSILKAVVIDIDRERRHLFLSSRASKLYPEQNRTIVDREITSISELKAGEAVRGFIKSVSEHGLFVMLGRDVDARVQIKELFDDFIKDWKGRFQANQLVKGRILSIDADSKKVEMTFRSGDLKRDNTTPAISFATLREGHKVNGAVKRVEDYGIFIQIDGSKVSGLCHKSELSDSKNVDVTTALRTFREGDRVKVVILSIDKEKRQLSLGLKPSYFADEDFGSENEDTFGANDPVESYGVVEDDYENQDMEDLNTNESPDGHDVALGDLDESLSEDGEYQMQIDLQEKTQTFQPGLACTATRRSTSKNDVPSLKLSGGFQWSGMHVLDNESPSESSEESDVDDQGKKKRKRKVIEQDLTADMHAKTPQSNMDYERLLLGSPNSSYLWIQYMSFQLQLSEVEKARDIGRRALKTTYFQEEQEKLNVWIALLNLENVYGSDETMESTFKDAVRHNDSKTIHLRLASIFDETEKHAKAEEQYKRTCKKFSHSSKVWTLYAEHLLRKGDVEAARKLLPRSLQSLEKRKHLKTISKFAQLEYKLGDPERGKTIFEGIVDSHPKRWDLWSIYMDMESSQGDIQNLRNLFDRIFTLKMTSHKAKSFFKKWHKLEQRLGDEDGVKTVKEKAIEWTRMVSNPS